MKYLFVIQGEGRGHLTQALSMKSMLERHGHEVVGMLVGKSSHRSLPSFFMSKAGVPIRMFDSPNFLPTAANKRSAIGRSIVYNLFRLHRFAKSLWFLSNQIKTSGADVVINFYELLTGLLYGVAKPDVPYFCIGHQYLFLHDQFSFPHVDSCSLILLKVFTRLTSLRCEKRLALSLRDMRNDLENRIFVVPPLLRPEVLFSTPTAGDYLLGYMVNAGFASDVQSFHERRPDVSLRFFWDKPGALDDVVVDATLSFHKINDQKFLQYMRKCRGYATTAGFESVCEAIYLGKPVLMVPAHIEQECNAWDAMQIGAGLVSRDFDLEPLLDYARYYKPNTQFAQWVRNAEYRIVPLLQPASDSESGLSHIYASFLKMIRPI